jgi:hypothetical protein
MRPKLLAAVLVAVLVVGAGAALVLLRLSGSGGSGHSIAARTPAVSATASPATPVPSQTPATSVTPTPTPTATATPTAAVADTCTGSQLNAVVGAGNSASGGREGVTVLIGNASGAACALSGAVQAQLLGSTGSPLPTSQSPATEGEAWLVPDRVALDPWEPQPGEASVLIAWNTGDSGPGVCSGSAPQAGELKVTFPGGGSIAAPVNPSPLLSQGMAPCQGAIQVGAITQVSGAKTFTTDAQDAAEFEVSQEEGQTVTTSCTPAGGQSCLTGSGETLGTDAADFVYQSYGTGGGAVCYAYVYQDSAGWHPLQVLCTQDTAPVDGGTVNIAAPGGGCVNVHSTPGHATSVLSCVASSSQTTYAVAQGPVYVAETDSTTHLPMGTLWWYVSGPNGWVAQDFVAGPAG